MGDPGSFYRPDRWNPDGYFEQPDIHAVNMPLVNGLLWKFAYFFLPSEETIRRRGRSRRRQIQEVGAKYSDKVVKENRFCLTLPAWLEQGVEVDRVLLVLREPIEVARSLRKRNRIALKRGYSLWLVHNQRLLKTVEHYGIPVDYVAYHHLLDPRGRHEEAGRIMEFAGVDLDEASLQRVVSEVVKPRMNHHRHTGSSPAYPPAVQELWTRLMARWAEQVRLGELPGAAREES